MFWKILQRTVQSVVGAAGLVMEAIGLYFNIAQVAEAPSGPFGWSILVWGVILFTLSAISIIAQLWWHINKLEDSYACALAFDGLQPFPGFHVNKIRLALVFSNTLDRPLEYQIDTDETFLEIGGQRASEPQYDSTGSTIPKTKPHKFLLPEVDLPQNYPVMGLLHYKLRYGRPGNLRFQQVKSFNLELTSVIKQGAEITIPLVWKETYGEDGTIGRNQSKSITK